MTLQLQIDKNSFHFHIIYIGMNPLKAQAATRTKKEVHLIRRVYIDLDYDGETALEAIYNLQRRSKGQLRANQLAWQISSRLEGGRSDFGTIACGH